jgi:hypothetical protein
VRLVELREDVVEELQQLGGRLLVEGDLRSEGGDGRGERAAVVVVSLRSFVSERQRSESGK